MIRIPFRTLIGLLIKLTKARNNAKYAILIPWVETGSGDALLLEVRSQLVKQPGEVCFP